MITPAPQIPQNLSKKLETAVKSFQREYDKLTLAEARRLLARHDYRMPVLGRLEYHGNGALKGISLRENLKRQAPSERQISANLALFGDPSQGARELWTPLLRWLVAVQVKKHRKNGWYQTDKLSNEGLEDLLRKLPEKMYGHLSVQDASLLMLRMMAEMERDARKKESNHQALQRLARPLPPLFVEEMQAEREAASRWFDEETAKGYAPFLRHETRCLPEEERVILSYRDDHDKN